MKRTQTYRRHDVDRSTRADGTVLLQSNLALGPVAANTGEWLHHWAAQSADHIFLAERSGEGWREEGYASVLQQVRAIAASLLARGLTGATPILIISGNGVDHGLLTLAAQYVGIPTVPVAEQYSLIPAAHGRLEQVIRLTRPAMIYTADAEAYASALALDAARGIEIVASRTAGKENVTSFDNLLKGDESVDVSAARASVTPDTIAKILMTSGSTSDPKGVLTTQAMICTNQAQLAAALPVLTQRPPRIVDWLPWNHVFGGSHNFNMMLANGGSIYIDDGKPAMGPFERTVENLGMVTGTLAFNVPVGFSLLLAALRADTSLRERFFGELDLLFYAGASLPQDVWEGFENMAMEVRGEVPLMISSWGLTETAPAVTVQQEPTATSGVVGVPVPGTVAKLIPNDENRYEIRVKGPNVMPGYFDDPQQTAAAFDDEGYFITGDTMRFVDHDDANAGLRFDGRITEDFKLLTGTWVRAAGLRLDALKTFDGLASDLVITGADRETIGVLIVADNAALRRQGFDPVDDGGALSDPALLEHLCEKLATRARTVSGSSNTISRALILAHPPSIADGEITAKGNLNFRRILLNRQHLVERLYTEADPAVATLERSHA